MASTQANRRVVSPFPGSRPLSAASLHRGACLAVDLAAADGLALVVRLFAFHQRKGDLDAALLHVHPQWNQRQSLLHHAASQFLDLVAVEEELAVAPFLVMGIAGVAVGTDVHVQQPDFALVNPCVAVPQVDRTFANRFHFSSEQDDTRFPGVEDVIVVEGLAIVREVAFGLFALGLFSGHGSPRIVPRTPEAWREQRATDAFQPTAPWKTHQRPNPNAQLPKSTRGWELDVGSWELTTSHLAREICWNNEYVEASVSTQRDVVSKLA